MAKTAIYYPPDGEPRELIVTREHAKKNPKDELEIAYVDLAAKQTGEDGKEKEVLNIGKCPVSDEPKVGHCVIVGAKHDPSLRQKREDGEDADPRHPTTDPRQHVVDPRNPAHKK